ncbi:unnamed protein product [Rhizoctonia solani]|uniref:F-box domain-containing protein n=1 Tax=Rhizoctonia solani TaxID=456999 RepID=A0A8H3CNJ0_9AGAM|nr:unnamed protein product [Rhizoctonia solani]
MPDEKFSSPINKLPPELLSKIFITFATSLTAHNYPFQSFAHYAIKLSSVCTAWRQAVNSTPTLWTSVDFMRQGQSLSELRHIHLCLERSRNAPLHLRIGRMDFECPLPAMNVELSTLIHSSAPRLRSLAIAFWRFGLAKEILGTLDALGASNTLHELALYATSGDKLLYADSDFLPRESLDRILSSLRYLYLDSVSLDWNMAYLSCRNLVELQLIEIPMNGYPTSLRLAQLLEGNKGLRSIKFSRFELRDYTVYPGQATIELPELSYVQIYMHPRFIAWFFGLPIKTASDLNLWLASYLVDAYISPVRIALNSFFERHSITSLCLSGDWLPLPFVARNLSKLKMLRIYGHYLGNYAFVGMEEAADLFPHLHAIDIFECVAQIEDIEPGFRTLLSIPSMRDIGIVGASLYAQRFSEQTLLDMDGTRQWLVHGNVSARISDSPQTQFYTFTTPLR